MNSDLRTLFNIIHEDCDKLAIVTLIKITVINNELCPGNCTMAIEPLEDNRQYLTKRKIIIFMKSYPFIDTTVIIY